jgi:hypothetical protein
LKNGPPALTRIEDYLAVPQANDTNEVNMLAEIDTSDIFKLTISKDGAETAKYFVPLYAATKDLPKNTNAPTPIKIKKKADINTRYKSNILARKMLIGAIVSDNPNIMEKTVELSSGQGAIGSIIKLDGQITPLNAKYEKQAQAATIRLGIIYGEYGMKPVYLKPYFGNRAAILQNRINQDNQDNPVYPFAYALLLIAYFRCLWSLITKVSGTSDPSFINALIRRFGGRPRSPEIIARSARIKRKKTSLFKHNVKRPETATISPTGTLILKNPNEMVRKPNLFGHLKQASKQPAKPPIETAAIKTDQVFVRQFGKT